jgi:toxin FitB
LKRSRLLSDAAEDAGSHLGFADVSIAAIAKSRELVILSLNLRHFYPLGVATLNPFDPD